MSARITPELGVVTHEEFTVAGIKYEEFVIHGISSALAMNRSEAEKYQSALNARLAKGRYNLEEAAILIGKETGERADKMLGKLVQAVGDYVLPVYEPGKAARYKCDKVRKNYEEAYWSDLNAWLVAHEPRIAWRYPAPQGNVEAEIVGAGGTANCGPVANAEIPGKLPNTSVGKLAIEAAWQIESKTNRSALAREVMTQLQAWADAGSKPDVLLKSNKEKRGVQWRTMKGHAKLYDMEACGKALAAWSKSRA